MVDLLRQAAVAQEVIHEERLAAHLEAMGRVEVAGYVAAELYGLGLSPGGEEAQWLVPYENEREVPAVTAPLELVRDGRRVALAAGDAVVALGTPAPLASLRDVELVFTTLDHVATGGAFAGRALLVFIPPAAPGEDPAAVAAALCRRAGAARAAALLLVPAPGSAVALPTLPEAVASAAGSGVPVVGWLSADAAESALRTLVGASRLALARVALRPEALPLPLGQVAQLAVERRVERDARSNLVGVLSARARGGEEQGDPEALAVLAAWPHRRDDPGAVASAQRAAVAELLGVAAAFQALPDPPQREVVFALVEPGVDGGEGVRHLLADPRWPRERMSAALVLGGGVEEGREVTLLPLGGSPLAASAQAAASRLGRAVVPGDGRGATALRGSPAWALLAAGVPALLVAPAGGPLPPTAPAARMVADAQLAFRLALDLAEAPRSPARVEPARVEAALRAAAGVVATPPPPAPRPRRPPLTTGAAEATPASSPAPAPPAAATPPPPR